MRQVLFFSILLSMIVGHLLWWRQANRLVKQFRHPRLWQAAVWIWCGTIAGVMGLIILARIVGGFVLNPVPAGIMATVYIWHVLFVFEWLNWRAGVNAIGLGRRIIRGRAATVSADNRLAAGTLRPQAVASSRPPSMATAAGSQPIILPASKLMTGGASRRQLLTAAALATPPALSMLAAWRAVSQIDQFRVRQLTLRIPNLPPPLEGLKIAHVSDIHLGTYTDDAMLRSIVERTNAMRADLVLFNGDLIDWDIADLPAGLQVLQKLDPAAGLCMCEGNHDLLSGRLPFEQAVRAGGFPLPINDSHFFTVRGYPVQVMALRWGGPDQHETGVGATDTEIAGSTRELVTTVQPDAFPILLAHHPHAFDYIGDVNVPLTLSGHTHGGQINLGPIRPAALRFRYLSGLYQKYGRQLVVSNGVGNWFPLRIGAPAEIGELTLRRA